jgi:hypothetical protein
MSVKYQCDACGKQEPARININGSSIQPKDWYIRTVKFSAISILEMHTCCMECAMEIDKRMEKLGEN